MVTELQIKDVVLRLISFTLSEKKIYACIQNVKILVKRERTKITRKKFARWKARRKKAGKKSGETINNREYPWPLR